MKKLFSLFDKLFLHDFHTDPLCISLRDLYIIIWKKFRNKISTKIFRFFCKKVLTNRNRCDIIVKQSARASLSADAKHGGIAQLARALGSYPKGRGFKSNFRYHGNETKLP